MERTRREEIDWREKVLLRKNQEKRMKFLEAWGLAEVGRADRIERGEVSNRYE